MKKIKVLQVIGSLRVGGAESVAMNFYRYIDREKFEFHYLVYGNKIETYEDEVEKLGGKVIHISSPNEGYKRFIKNVRNIICEQGPYEIIHSHTLYNSGLVLKAAHLEKVPVRIAHAHSERKIINHSWLKKIYVLTMKKFLAKYSNVFMSCSEVAGNYLFTEKAFKEKGIIIRNGISLEKYVFSEKIRNDIRERYNLKNHFVIGHVGRLSKVKNHAWLLEVFKEILNVKKDAVLLLVGEGDQRSFIEEKIKFLNINQNVILTGTKTDANDYMNAMDVFLFPSHYEGLGIAVIEAQANGLKCIVSNAIPKEAVVSNNVEFLSLNEDISIWLEKIITVSKDYNREATVVLPEVYDVKNQVELLQSVYLNRLNQT